MRRTLLLALCLALAGCDSGGGKPKAPPAKLPPGPTFRLALSAEPTTLDPALAADLPSVNVVRQFLAGLTRIEGRRAVPDLAERWERSEGGRVWTFRLRNGLEWSDGKPITAADFRAAWLRALAPRTHSAYARAEMLNIAGAREFRSGSGQAEDVGVEAVDERTLRVTLRHPVPWLDQQVAYPVFFPRRGQSVSSGPFRLVQWRGGQMLVLERNPSYWNAKAVRPGRILLSFVIRGHPPLDGVLPAAVLAPGFPWIDTRARIGADKRARVLPTLSVMYLWFATKHPPLDDPAVRRSLSEAIDRPSLARPAGGAPLDKAVPPLVPGAEAPKSGFESTVLNFGLVRRTLVLAFTTQDPHARAAAKRIAAEFGRIAVRVRLSPVPTRAALLARAGPPARPGVDLVLLGWSGEFFDAYNFLDQFPCTSGLNVAGWCDPDFDALMAKAVRTLDDGRRHGIERRLEEMLTGAGGAFPAAPLYTVTDRVRLLRGVTGFGYSPLGFWDLRGLRAKRPRS